MLFQFQQKFGPILQKFKQFRIMLLQIQSCSSSGYLTFLINLFNQRIDSLTSLSCHILIICRQIVVQFIKQIRIVLGGYKLALE